MSPTSPFLSDAVEEACRELFENRNRPRNLIRALARRSPDERRGIKTGYLAIYGEELVERLRRVKEANPESDQQVWSGLWLWMMEPPERDAAVAGDAIGRGGDDDYKALVEIYVLRKSSHLFSSKQAYLMKFRRHLDSDVLFACTERQGSKILAALAASHRSHQDHEVSQHIGNCDAKRLHEALKRSEGRMKESSTIIVEIFSKRSIPQLRLAFSSYTHIYGHDFIEALETINGEFEESLRVVIQCMCTPFTYFSEMIHLSLTADATKKTVLTRVMIRSAEAGMEKVKAAYERRYTLKLEDAIAERVRDDENYRDFLLALSNAHG